MYEEMMLEALREAELAREEGEVPVGAVICCEGRIVARAHNRREADTDPTAHAEMLAIRSAARALGKRRLSGCRLYVTLEPCPMCAGAIALSGLDEVIFGAYDPKAGCAGSVYGICEDTVFGPGVPCSGGLLETECAGLMDSFFASKR